MLKVAKTKLRGSFRPSSDQALPSVAALFYVLHSPYLRWLQTSALHSPLTHLSLLLLFQIIITIIASGIIYTRSDWHKLHTKASCKGIVNTMYNISTCYGEKHYKTLAIRGFLEEKGCLPGWSRMVRLRRAEKWGLMLPGLLPCFQILGEEW